MAVLWVTVVALGCLLHKVLLVTPEWAGAGGSVKKIQSPGHDKNTPSDIGGMHDCLDFIYFLERSPWPGGISEKVFSPGFRNCGHAKMLIGRAPSLPLPPAPDFEQQPASPAYPSPAQPTNIKKRTASLAHPSRAQPTNANKKTMKLNTLLPPSAKLKYSFFYAAASLIPPTPDFNVEVYDVGTTG